MALACGAVAIFRRNMEGEWDLSKYHLVQIGLPYQSVRQLAVVGDKVWCGYRNKLHVLEPKELKIVHTLEAHPRRDSPVCLFVNMYVIILLVGRVSGQTNRLVG